MAKGDKNFSGDVPRETIKIDEISSINTSTKPVTEQNELIKPNHIGIIHKDNKTGHIGQVHSSMRKYYENEDWIIIESKQKKTISIPDRADKETPAKIVTNK